MIMSFYDEIIALMQAAKEGKHIQRRRLGYTEWSDQTGEGWNFAEYAYRIKPEPREIWLQEIGPGLWQQKFDGVSKHFPEVKHFMEVLE